MLTGDSERTAAAIAAQVGVDEYRAEVLPEDKAHFVQAERSQGRTVVMIGDGVNDSPALSAANVGIAISDGAAIAREIADITIAANDLFELVQLRRLSMALMNRIQSNYRFVIGFNGGLIALGALGVLAPATSATLHNLSTLGISLRSMTDLLEQKNEGKSMNTAPSDRMNKARRGCVLCCDLSYPCLGLSTERWTGKGHCFATTRYILNGVTAWTAWGMPAGMMTASPAFSVCGTPSMVI